MRHVVIGGAGFIGVNLATRLAEQQEEVTVLDDLSRRGADQNAAWLESRHPEVRIVRADIRRFSGSSTRPTSSTTSRRRSRSRRRSTIRGWTSRSTLSGR
jgi:nucleoside-diphosphate-sugar epimerase